MTPVVSQNCRVTGSSPCASRETERRTGGTVNCIIDKETERERQRERETEREAERETDRDRQIDR